MTSDTTDDLEGKLTRRNALAIAILGFIGSMIVSVAAGVIAGQQASSNIRTQVEAASQQSQTDFLRSQRQSVYGKFASSLGLLYDCESKWERLVMNQNTKLSQATINKANAQRDECSDLYESTNRQLGPITIISTPAISDKADELLTKIFIREARFQEYVDLRAKGDVGGANKLFDKAGLPGQDIYNAKQNLYTMMRQNLLSG